LLRNIAKQELIALSTCNVKLQTASVRLKSGVPEWKKIKRMATHSCLSRSARRPSET